MKEIFKILEKDSRTTPEELASMTGLQVAQVQEILERAEEDRTILKYKAVINWQKLQEEQVSALIEVKIQPERDKGFDAVAERIYRFPEARSVYLVSGQYDLGVLVAGRTMQEVASFVAHKLAPLSGVQSTVTHFIMKRYKEDGELLEEDDELKRLPLSL